MAELVRTDQGETARFLENIGYPLGSAAILEVFLGYFENRRVIRVVNTGKESSRVLKIRPEDQGEAQREVENMQKLVASYRFSGGHFGGLVNHALPSNYRVINMPYLGRDILELGRELGLVDLGYLNQGRDVFAGFGSYQAEKLVRDLRHCHYEFAQKYGLIHGDLWQGGAPNNLVYNFDLGRLLPIDAEALAPTNEERLTRFEEQTGCLEEWLCQNLVV